MRSVRAAFRRLQQQPTFAAAAVTVLALGIAAPTALFTLLNATLLRPLPYPQAENLYAVRTYMTDGRFTIGKVASAEFNALRRTTDLVAASALLQVTSRTLQTSSGAHQVSACVVSTGFFDLFQLPIQIGRGFTTDDQSAVRGTRVVLSHRAWVDIYGRDLDIVGRTITFTTGPDALVVGVAPSAFAIPAHPDLWVAMPPSDDIGHAYDGYLRLKPGVRPQAVQAQLGGMWNALAAQYPDQDKNRAFVIEPLLQVIVGDLGPIVVIAFAATGLLLLLAIVNVASLLLARAITRGRELATRTALGATRADLVRFLLSESLLIAGAATLVAVPLVMLAVKAVLLIGGAQLPRIDGLTLDPTVFAFAAALMLLAGGATGLAPLATIARQDLTALMNEGGRGGLQGRVTTRLLRAMIVVEVALAVALVAGAGRLVLSTHHLLALDPGFTSAGRLAIDVEWPMQGYEDDAVERGDAWDAAAEGRLRALGATTVGMASSVPLRREWDSTTFVNVTGHPTDPANRPNARLRVVSPEFFDAMGMRLEAGRGFTRDDRRGGAPAVIVNRAWARRFLGGRDPLGERIAPGTFGHRVDGKFVQDDAPIVGVLRDVPYAGLPVPPEPMVFVSMMQTMAVRKTIIITTADGRPERLIPAIRAELAKLDARVPVNFQLMSEAMAASMIWSKLGLLLMVTFGALGLVLAATGVFGVIAFVGAQRAGEMAVRLALGGTPGHVFGLILRQGATLAGAGLVGGVLLAWWLGVPLASYVYQVSPGNGLVLTTSAVVVFLAAIAATVPSARRAATTEPARVFRT